MIFTTDENLKLMNDICSEASNSIHYADGTFEVSSEIFYQLYTISIIHNGKCNFSYYKKILIRRCVDSFTQGIEVTICSIVHILVYCEIIWLRHRRVPAV